MQNMEQSVHIWWKKNVVLNTASVKVLFCQ